MNTNSPGERIKYFRNVAGLSQEELGRRVGVQRAAINKYEKGTVENIPLTTIEKMADVLEVSPAYLVGWDNQHASNLSWEVRVIQGVNLFYGKDGVDVLENYSKLNPKGKDRANQYLDELSMIYRHGEE